MLERHPIAIGLARGLLRVSSINKEHDVIMSYYRQSPTTGKPRCPREALIRKRYVFKLLLVPAGNHQGIDFQCPHHIAQRQYPTGFPARGNGLHISHSEPRLAFSRHPYTALGND